MQGIFGATPEQRALFLSKVYFAGEKFSPSPTDRAEWGELTRAITHDNHLWQGEDGLRKLRVVVEEVEVTPIGRWVGRVTEYLRAGTTNPLLVWPQQVSEALNNLLSESTLGGDVGRLLGEPPSPREGPLPSRSSRALHRALCNLRQSAPSKILDSQALIAALPTLPEGIVDLLLCGVYGRRVSVITSDTYFVKGMLPLLEGVDIGSGIVQVLRKGLSSNASSCAVSAIHQASALWLRSSGNHSAERLLAGLPESLIAAHCDNQNPSSVSDDVLRNCGSLIIEAFHVDLGVPPGRLLEQVILSASNSRFPGPGRPRVGDIWFLIPTTWMRKWEAWCRGGAIEEGGEEIPMSPGPVTVEDLCVLESGTPFPEVRPDLRFGIAYDCIGPRPWKALTAWHGIKGFPIPRAIIDTGKGRESQLQRFCSPTTTTTTPHATAAPSSALLPKKLVLEVYLLKVALLQLAHPSSAKPPQFLPYCKPLPEQTIFSLGLGPHPPTPIISMARNSCERWSGSGLVSSAPPRPNGTLLVSRTVTAADFLASVTEVVMVSQTRLLSSKPRLRLWRAVQESDLAAAGIEIEEECPSIFPEWPFLPLIGPSLTPPPQLIWEWPETGWGSKTIAEETHTLPSRSWLPQTMEPPASFRILLEARGGIRGHWMGDYIHSSKLPLAQIATRTALLNSPLNLKQNSALYLPVGLRNPGAENQCWLLCSLQALFSLPYVPHYFAHGKFHSDLNNDHPLETRIACTFASTVRACWGKSGLLNPRKLRRLLVRACGGLACGDNEGGGGIEGRGGEVWANDLQQEDAEEALSRLLLSLHIATNRGKVDWLQQGAEPGGGVKELPCSENELAKVAALQAGQEKENSFLSSLFRGQYSTKVVCEDCGHSSQTFSSFWLHSIPLPPTPCFERLVVYLAPNPLQVSCVSGGSTGGKFLALPLRISQSSTIKELKVEALKALRNSVDYQEGVNASGVWRGGHHMRYSVPEEERTGNFALTPDSLVLVTSKGTLICNGGGGCDLGNDDTCISNFYPLPSPPSNRLMNPGYHLILYPVPPLNAYTSLAPKHEGISIGAPVTAPWTTSRESGISVVQGFPGWVVAKGAASNTWDVEFEDGDKASIEESKVTPRTPLPATLHIMHTTMTLAGRASLPGLPSPPTLYKSACATWEQMRATENLFPFIPHPHLTPPGLQNTNFFLSPLVLTPLPLPPILTRVSPRFTSLAALYLMVYHTAKRWIKGGLPEKLTTPDPFISQDTLACQAEALPSHLCFERGSKEAEIRDVWGFVLRVASRGGIGLDSESVCPLCPWVSRCKGCIIPPHKGIYLSHLKGIAPPGVLSTAEGGVQGDTRLWVNLNAEWGCDIIEGGGWDVVEGCGAKIVKGEMILGDQQTSLDGCMSLFSEKCKLDDYSCPTCDKSGNPPSLAPLAHATTTTTDRLNRDYTSFSQPPAPLSMQPKGCFQTISLYTLPPILVLQLKRFSFVGVTRNKLHTPVSIPLTLAIPTRIPGEEKHHYHLYACINHYGAINGGHYETTIRVGDKWRVCNDEVVTTLEEAEVNEAPSSSAYVVFYVRQDLHLSWKNVCSEHNFISPTDPLEESFACLWPTSSTKPVLSPRTIDKITREATVEDGRRDEGGEWGIGGGGVAGAEVFERSIRSVFSLINQAIPWGGGGVCQVI